MEFLTELIKIALPAGLVLYAMYLVVKSFVTKELGQQQTELKLKLAETNLKYAEETLTIRLQAYERITLFLERISPQNLIPRVSNAQMTVGILQQILINEIRNEFAHNLSQQIYMSSEAWNLTKKAMEETILLINNSTIGLEDEQPGVELGKKVLENMMAQDLAPTQEAIDFVKDEVRQFFITSEK